jgi:octaprenyl-diphosphate synthase
MWVYCTRKMEFTKQLIRKELAEFEAFFAQYLQGHGGILDTILKYLVRQKGKKMRPMFVLLSAKLGGEINQATFRAASLVELLHTATLVHDDVVDNAMERRGIFSINALWKNKIAVLVGDFLLSKGLLLSVDHGDYSALQTLSLAVKKMSEGELLQLEKARSINLNEEIYFTIIRGKTASLLASSCMAGAQTTIADAEKCNLLYQFGEAVGMAFQIRDDLFDYDDNTAGKPIGLDIREKKITLPLLYALNNASTVDKKKLLHTVKKNTKSNEEIQWIVQEAHRLGGVAYATETMHNFKKQALHLLHSFPENDARKALEELVLFTIDRKN